MPGQLIVFSTPAEGREDEYNAWYDQVHLGEVLALPPFTAARRLRVSEAQVFPQEHRYAAIYDFSGSAPDAIAALTEGFGTMAMSDAMAASELVLLEER